MDLKEILNKVHNDLLTLRRIEFQLASLGDISIPDDAGKMLLHLIKQLDEPAIQAMTLGLIHVADSDLGEKSVRELRTEAQRLGIKYYTTMTKSQLLSAITSRTQKNVGTNP